MGKQIKIKNFIFILLDYYYLTIIFFQKIEILTIKV